MTDPAQSDQHTDIDELERPLRAVFADLEIETRTHRHDALHTVAQSRELRGTLPGGHVKNLFLRDKKRAKWLVTLREDRAVDLKILRRLLDTSGNLSFGSAELLYDSLGVAPGSVTPFAVMNDAQGAVRFIMDRELFDFDLINAHPLHNEATVTIRCRDLLRFLEHCNHPPLVVDFDTEHYQISSSNPLTAGA